MRANDSRQPLAKGFLDLDNRRRRNDFSGVVVVTLPCNVSLLVLEDLFLHLIEHCGNGRVHIRGNFFGMIEVVPRSYIDFRNMPLVLFNSQDEMRFQNFVNNPS